MSEEILKRLKDSIIDGDEDDAIEAAKEALAANLDIKKILDEGIINGAEEVGSRYEKREFFLTELIMTADAMTAAMEILQPLLEKSDSAKKATILIGTVQGDMHNIGKNIVKSLLQGQGYNVIDLGIDVPPEKFVEEAKKSNPDVIGLSALLTMAISKMHETILALKEENITSKIIVGGGILSQDTCDKIRADAWTKDAYDGVLKVGKLLGDL
ncbi:MAG: cobalamin-binding protein [archaeon]|nr:cobalamin-binding protein [archaeon]